MAASDQGLLKSRYDVCKALIESKILWQFEDINLSGKKQEKPNLLSKTSDRCAKGLKNHVSDTHSIISEVHLFEIVKWRNTVYYL